MVRQILKFTASLLVLGLLAACSSPSSDVPDKAADQPAAAEVRKPTVFDDQLKALDKAKAVEATLKKAEAERSKEIDEQSGG
ncbi:MAG TPA: hypothetical protein VFN25_01955 [Dokdonella sp.]|uniref:hypothetical protein n=1 Tax=Dokdonella sp. TaxID=2291710 RepID=UPI002D7F3DB7|nr:hypothetical protein [Dokdonella sp.]HET9031648.1 hypothetical protein [Dokdonella sp.]